MDKKSIIEQWAQRYGVDLPMLVEQFTIHLLGPRASDGANAYVIAAKGEHPNGNAFTVGVAVHADDMVGLALSLTDMLTANGDSHRITAEIAHRLEGRRDGKNTFDDTGGEDQPQPSGETP